MAKLDFQKVSKSPSITYVAASATGDTYDNFNEAFVHIKNANATTARVVTVLASTDPVVTREAGSLPVADITVTVPAGDSVLFSATPAHVTAGGQVALTYDDAADLTLAALHVAQ